jgi:hypothetical protein
MGRKIPSVRRRSFDFTVANALFDSETESASSASSIGLHMPNTPRGECEHEHDISFNTDGDSSGNAGSDGYGSKYGGMSNELNNILSLVSNGTYERIPIGDNRYLGLLELSLTISSVANKTPRAIQPKPEA